MLHLPPYNKFHGRITNLGSAPSGTAYGTSITPGQNTFPAYVEILGNTAFDTYFLEIIASANAVSAVNRNTLLTIGIDHSGGTTYTDVEINHLIVTAAAPIGIGCRRYWFPLFIPAGSALAAKASVDNATVGTLRVAVNLWGKPSRPEMVRAGAYIDTFGAVTATSEGTVVTPGNAVEGTWTSLASNIAKDYWWWQGGCGTSDTTLTSGSVYWLDVGVGTSSTVVDPCFQNQLWGIASSTEQVQDQMLPEFEYVSERPGDGVLDVWARLACNTTPDTDMTVVAYALGG